MATVILRPNGAGDSTQWVASGTNWQDMSDVNDGTSISADTPGQQDLYTVANLGVSGITISDVTIFCRNSGYGAGDDLFQFCWKVGLNETRSPEYNFNVAVAETGRGAIENPNGGEWTEADVNAMQIGIILNNIDAFTVQLYMHDIWIQVTYTVNSGRVVRAADGLSGLGGAGQMSWDPLG